MTQPNQPTLTGNCDKDYSNPFMGGSKCCSTYRRSVTCSSSTASITLLAEDPEDCCKPEDTVI